VRRLLACRFRCCYPSDAAGFKVRIVAARLLHANESTAFCSHRGADNPLSVTR